MNADLVLSVRNGVAQRFCDIDKVKKLVEPERPMR